MSVSVLVLYDPKGPAIEALAAAVGRGIDNSAVAKAVLKSVAEAKTQDLMQADALALGSPNWSGITGTLKSWLDEQGDLWEEGSLAGKPGAAFTSGWGRHSGLEITLWQVIHWMLACGMVIVGLPWSDPMRTSGSYYGATATGGVSDEDLAQAEALGRRLAHIADRLQGLGDSS
ncbi:MAG: NAD(P)H-dependent oxidoreductase [Dehalococcoidia bacterium]